MEFDQIFNDVEFNNFNVKVETNQGKVKYEANDLEFPVSWSKTACNIAAYNFFRREFVPASLKKVDEEGVPSWLQRSEPSFEKTSKDHSFKDETSIKQVISRMAGAWTYWGWKLGYFGHEIEAKNFFKFAINDLINQKAAPNTPQWLNTGLWWAYGTSRKDPGYYTWDHSSNSVIESPCSFKHPLLSACFILSVEDNLTDPNGIYDLITKEAKIFKFGAGSGVNFSKLRSREASLSTGHKSSGALQFIKLTDFSASSIKSGGIDRGSSKMAILDVSHPEIESFCAWKAETEMLNNFLLQNKDLIQRHLNQNNTSTTQAFEIKGLGSNTNISVLLTDDFLDCVHQDRDWELRDSNGEVIKKVSARKIWNDICYYAWLCGDPGVQFTDTINIWNTCKASGRIEASNPCAEFLFLNDTSCNLASLNLLKFLSEDGSFCLKDFINSVKLWTTILDISISFAQYPSSEICEKTISFRPLGLGFTNLGSFLMQLALPYDSDEARDIAALITACLTASAYLSSVDLAEKLGSFSHFPSNEECFKEILNLQELEFNKLVKSIKKSSALRNSNEVIEWVTTCFKRIKGKKFRNAQHTCIAPTGTISILMDAETTGIEPEFNLIKVKRLSNGAYLSFVNKSFIGALKKLGYSKEEIEEIKNYIVGHRTIVGAPGINHSSLKEIGFSEESLSMIEELILKYDSLKEVFQVGNFSKEFLANNLMINTDSANDPTFCLLDLLNFSQEEIEKADRFCFGHKTILGAPNLKREHLKIFQVANGTCDLDTISVEGHVKMVAECQKFLSGGISKTVNLPSSASIDDVERVFLLAHKLKCKSITVYRDGSKNWQPLSKNQEKSKLVPQRRTLPSRRRGFTQKVVIAGQKIYLRTGEYEDGSLGEIFIDLSKEGAALRSIMNHFAIAVSIGLQYGVPLEEFVDAFIFTKYEPSGPVLGSQAIKNATSISDYIFRELAIHYLKRSDLAHSMISEEQKIFDKKEIKYFEGDACPECGNFTLLRSGSCLKCITCGYSRGCA